MKITQYSRRSSCLSKNYFQYKTHETSSKNGNLNNDKNADHETFVQSHDEIIKRRARRARVTPENKIKRKTCQREDLYENQGQTKCIHLDPAHRLLL